MAIEPSKSSFLTRLLFILFAPMALAACVTTQSPQMGAPLMDARYDAINTERFPVDAVDLTDVDPKYRRQVVDYPTSQPPGTIVVDINNRYLYLVQKGGKAMRYGVGVGKEGYSFRGTATVGRKAEWPSWTPTPNMIRREPKRYGPYAGGLPGGETNPLGPRALYLYSGNRDTMFRIHGTTEPWSIGQQVSSGCIRLLNQDIIDLYERVPSGTKVVVQR